MRCRRCRYQPCQVLCHAGVTPGEVLISGHTIKLDEITRSVSIHRSAIFVFNFDLILTGNLEVPISDLRQIQRYQKCVIRDISKLNMLKNSVKHHKTVKNTRKQCETE